MTDLLDEVKRTYRNAKSSGREGAGMHRSTGQSGLVHNLWLEAIANAERAGLDWRCAMKEVNDE